MDIPSNIQVSVLPWVPPFVQGLVRDLRVRWALEEAGWAYRERFVSDEERQSADFRALQPFGQVPVYQSDEVSLFESGAIVSHIARRSPALMPQEAALRDEVTSWMFCSLNSVEPPIMMLNIFDMGYPGPKGEDVQGMRAWVLGWVQTRLDSLVQVLAGTEFLLDRFTAADLLLSSVLRILRDTDLVSSRPVLDAYQRRCEARPAFERALRDHLASFRCPR